MTNDLSIDTLDAITDNLETALKQVAALRNQLNDQWLVAVGWRYGGQRGEGKRRWSFHGTEDRERLDIDGEVIGGGIEWEHNPRFAVRFKLSEAKDIVARLEEDEAKRPETVDERVFRIVADPCELD
tara:strand:+ start:347 stop:727 length:381 start_codon:yes stop_codon:yes gene_type:complete